MVCTMAEGNFQTTVTSRESFPEKKKIKINHCKTNKSFAKSESKT